MPEPHPRAGDTGPDPPAPPRRSGRHPHPWAVLAAVAAGGALGSLARYGAHLAFPTAAGAFPWSTFAVNVSGCLLLGVLVVLTGEVWPHRWLLRPLLGVGALGGFTTFSFHVLQAHRLIETGAWTTAAAYLAVTAVAGVLAAYAGMTAAGRLVRALAPRVVP